MDAVLGILLAVVAILGLVGLVCFTGLGIMIIAKVFFWLIDKLDLDTIID